MKKSKLETLTVGSILILLMTFVDHSICNEQHNQPCNYYDTVDLTNLPKLLDNSYEYEGIKIPAHLIGIYDNYINHEQQHILIRPPQIRGCLCLIKTCVNWCCDTKLTFLYRNICYMTNETVSNELIINFNTNDSLYINFTDLYAPKRIYKPCAHMYSLNPQKYIYDKWQLFQNGSLYRYDDQQLFQNDQFCFAHTILDVNATDYQIAPFVCSEAPDNETRDVLYSYAMMFSIPFMVITVIIYILIPELRNLHGKSLACYLTGLIIAYSIFSYLLITAGKEVSITGCAALGFVSYFFFMSSFFWLSVISFDLYWNFRGTARSRDNDTKSFLLYGLYAWGLAGLFLIFTMFAQYSDFIPTKYKPGIGSELFCFLDVTTNFSATIYFYGPIMCLIIFNSVMFTMTSWKIYHVRREMSRIIAREDSRRNLNTQRDQFILFLRLFLVMGVTWIAEIISYFLSASLQKFFYVTDFLNLIQGFLIFALFVLKPKVKKLIMKSFLKSWLNSISLKTVTTSNDQPVNN